MYMYLLQELDVMRGGVVAVHHEREEWRLAAARVVDAAAVRHEAVALDQRQQVLDHAARRGEHLRHQQTADDPVRVPTQ